MAALATIAVCFCLTVIGAAPAAAAPVLPAGFEQSPGALGFGQPTAFAHTPDGRMFVAEKAGRVRVVAPGASAPQPGSVIDISRHVNSQSDRGLLGIAVDADYATNHFVYLLYAYEHNAMDPQGEKVAKLTRIKVGLTNNLEAGETTILGTSALTSCPAPDGNFANDADCIPAEYLWHTTGTVRSDPADGSLWVGTGDAQMSLNFSARTLQTQSEESYRGKILHIDRNGNGVAGHSFCPGVTDLTKPCTKIYAKGFRNPFRFTLRPGKGPIVGDVGADHREELDLVQSGGNYGWPCYEGTIRNAVHESSSACQALYAQGASAVKAPVWEYAHNVGNSIAAGPQYSGSTYPSAFTGDIFVADFARGWIKRLKVDAQDQLQSVHDFATFAPGEAAPVDLQQLPNGDLGYLDIGYTDNQSGLYRFRYTPTNASPVSRATGTPLSGAAPLTVAFDASASTDANGDALSYAWDFGDGTTGSGPRPSHTYTQAGGNHTARVTVSDGRGGSSSATVGPITPGNTPPTAAISAPSSFRYGQSVTVTGSATDSQDGSVPGSRMNWTVLQQHGNHTHPFTGCSATTSCTFNPGNDHDADSFFKVTLTVTDANGATDQKTVEVRPQTVGLTLASSPSGVPLQYSTATPAAAPSTYTAAAGFAATVIAPETWTSPSGTTYNFRSWSDLGARQHVYTVPAANATLTANYNAWPTARASANRTSGGAPLTVNFDAAGSTDPDSDALSYAWDFGDGTTGTGARPAHTYTQVGGTYTARVTVTDSRGGTSSATVGPITPGNSPPAAAVSAPPSFRYGQSITVTGSATDAQDGTVPASRMTWSVVQQHGAHTHPVATACTAAASCTFNPGTDHDADAFFRVTLTVTDANGATDQETVDIRPQTIALTLASSPAGVPLQYGTAAPAAAPSTHTAAVGFAAPVSAPATWTSPGGTTYNFRSWSDFGARQHVYTVGGTNTTLTANYNAWPSAVATADRTSGNAPLTVAFDASGSNDPDGDALTYAWSFGDGTTSNTAKPTKTYPPGDYTPTVTVSDGKGGSVTRTLSKITVTDGAPVATIAAPTTATRWTGGTDLALSGEATDAVDPSPSLVWKVVRRTGAQSTQVFTATGRTANFPVPTDFDADTLYEVTLTATDNAGKSSTAGPVRVDPRTAPVTLDSRPAGAPIQYGSASAVAAPFERTAAVGYRAPVSAAAEFTKAGRRYTFEAWADGAAPRNRTFAVPATPATLTARYNGWPTVGLVTDRATGPAPLEVGFTATGDDPDSDPLSYEWRFGDGTAATGRTATHRYAAPGRYTVTLTAADGRGGSDQRTATVIVGQRPTATVDAPADGSLFDALQRIELKGRGSDDQGTPALDWKVDLHRDSGVTSVPVSGNAFTVPADVTTDAWYEVTLTATDADGLTATDVVRVDPRTRTLRLDSDPAGAELTLNGSNVTAPATALAVVGTRAAIAAPASLDRGGRRWLFASWSNGGAREQSIAVPVADALLTARFAAEPSPPAGPQQPVTPQQQDPLVPQPQQPAQPQQPERPPQPGGSPEPAGPRPLELGLARVGLGLSRTGTARIVLRNPAEEGWRGHLVLTTTAKVRAGGWKARRVRFARKTVAVRPRASATVKVVLSTADRRLVGRLGRVRATLALEGAGESPSSQAQTVLLAPGR